MGRQIEGKEGFAFITILLHSDFEVDMEVKWVWLLDSVSMDKINKQLVHYSKSSSD